MSGHQLGDPAKAAQVMLQAATMSDRPPTRLLLGSDAFNLVRQNLQERLQQMSEWESVTRSTDHIED